MSTDVSEAIKAIKEMATMIDPDEDYLTVIAAKEMIASAKESRKKELESAHANLKALSKILDAARVSSSRPRAVLSAEEHAATLNTFDTSRLSLAKAISDVENLVASREAELASLKEKVRHLEDCDPAAEHKRELDGTALRLKIFQGMGFRPVTTEDGHVSKILIASLSGDVHSVDVDKRSTGYELSKTLWSTALS
ncbi:hypothetical protein BDZ89DRAFT_1098710, partial [Hymenopellis radicata]